MKKFYTSFFSMLLVFCSVFLLFSFGVKHPYHVSSLEINYAQKTSTVQLTGKFFTDDLEAALKKYHSRTIDLAKTSDERTQKLVADYAAANIRVKINGKVVPLHVVGYENERESTLLYLETPAVAVPTKMECSIGMLYNIYSDQMHIIHYIVNGERQSRKVNFPEMYSFALF